MQSTNQSKRELILLVEDDPDDELLALRTFRRSQVGVDVIVVRDGEEALDYLFGTGCHAGRDLSVMPTRINARFVFAKTQRARGPPAHQE